MKMSLGLGIAALVAAVLCVPGALSAPPSNDDFDSAILLIGSEGSVSGTNAEATVEVDEPYHAGDPGGHSVWFSWTAPRNGVVLIDTCDSPFDTLLAVYTGASLTQLNEVASDDDSCGLGSELAFDVIAGTVYRVAVDGAGGVTGPFVLWYAMTAENDNFADAEPITGVGGGMPGSVELATHELGEPLHAGERGTGSVWYTWSAPGDLRVNFDACGTGGDTLLAAYSGTSLDALTPIASDKDGCRLGGGIDFDAVAGHTYRIAADPTAPRTSIQLNWTTGPLVPRNLTPPTVSGAAVTNGVLTATPGTWAHATRYVYGWESCPPEGPTPFSRCQSIQSYAQPGGEGTIRLRTEQLGRRIRVNVIAIGPNGMRGATSEMTPVVTLGPPLNTQAPTLLGYTSVGHTLYVGEGAWDLGGAQIVGFTYLWQRCDAGLENCRRAKGPGAEKTYRLTASDLGSFIQVVVTLTTTGGAGSAVGYSQGKISPRVVRQQRCVVPRLVGKTLAKARKSLARAGCKLGRVTRDHAARKAGLIASQRPKPGTRLRAGGKVNVLVSKGRRR